ncbi:hypothetical protein [Variovorax sp. Varisp62]|uniref:hypothetical protein n=1 Tax=Variovorax sp. Varisp62 TaxID=3243049 RepID=UPI0039B4E2D2
MKLNLSYIADRGELKGERLVMVAAEDIDLGDYLVLCTRYEGTQLTTAVAATFWFPDEPLKKGDRVILYTKAGTPSSRDRASGGKSHFHYWGLEASLWSKAENGVVLLHAASWLSNRSDALPSAPPVNVAAAVPVD